MEDACIAKQCTGSSGGNKFLHCIVHGFMLIVECQLWFGRIDMAKFDQEVIILVSFYWELYHVCFGLGWWRNYLYSRVWLVMVWPLTSGPSPGAVRDGEKGSVDLALISFWWEQPMDLDEVRALANVKLDYSPYIKLCGLQMSILPGSPLFRASYGISNSTVWITSSLPLHN